MSFYRMMMEPLLEKGPSAQKYGVSPQQRKQNAAPYFKAAEKLKGKLKQVMIRLAYAIQDGEAKEAIELYGKLPPEARKAIHGFGN